MTTATNTSEREVLYVADPMCSWCWGFAPVSRQLADAVAGRAAMRVVPGGLSVGARTPLLPAEAAQIVQHWRHVAERTGQPFNFEHPVDHTTIYDSEPGCRALALMNLARPAATLAYLHTLQDAFYVERRDLRQREVLSELAAPHGLAEREFEDHFDARTTHDALDADLQLVRDLGIQGFPAVALRHGTRIQLLTVGYRDWAELAPHVGSWLNH